MGLLKLFDTSRIDDFAKSLARDFSRVVPTDIDTEDSKKNPRILAQGLEQVYTRALQFKQENKLGVYRKAKLANVFKWELKELGYSDKLADDITKRLAVRLARK